MIYMTTFVDTGKDLEKFWLTDGIQNHDIKESIFHGGIWADQHAAPIRRGICDSNKHRISLQFDAVKMESKWNGRELW